eukprot:tig00000178_g12737.t1
MRTQRVAPEPAASSSPRPAPRSSSFPATKRGKGAHAVVTPAARARPARPAASLLDLPTPLLLLILERLPQEDLFLGCAQACSALRSLVYDEIVWKDFSPRFPEVEPARSARRTGGAPRPRPRPSARTLVAFLRRMARTRGTPLPVESMSLPDGMWLDEAGARDVTRAFAACSRLVRLRLGPFQVSEGTSVRLTMSPLAPALRIHTPSAHAAVAAVAAANCPRLSNLEIDLRPEPGGRVVSLDPLGSAPALSGLAISARCILAGLPELLFRLKSLSCLELRLPPASVGLLAAAQPDWLARSAPSLARLSLEVLDEGGTGAGAGGGTGTGTASGAGPDAPGSPSAPRPVPPRTAPGCARPRTRSGSMPSAPPAAAPPPPPPDPGPPLEIPAGPPALACGRSLASIRLAGLPLAPGAGPSGFGHLLLASLAPSARSLELESCPAPGCLLALARWPALESLAVSRCPGLRGVRVAACPALRRLHAAPCPGEESGWSTRLEPCPEPVEPPHLGFSGIWS